MENKKLRWNNIYIYTIRMILQNSLSLIIGQLLLLVLFLIISIPLMSVAYHYSLTITGFSYVTMENMQQYLLHPVSILMLILLFFFIGLFLLLEIYYLLTFFMTIRTGKKLNIIQVIIITLYRFIFGLLKGNIKLIPTAWMTLIVFNLPFFMFVFSKSRTLKFIAEAAPEGMIPTIAALIIVWFLYVVFSTRAFLFHYFLYDGMRYTEALKHAIDSKRNKTLQTIIYFVIWNLIICLIIAILYAFTMAVTIFIVSGTFNRELSIAAFLSVNDDMKTYLFTAVFIICTICNLALYTELFYRYQLAPELKDSDKELTEWSIFNDKPGRNKSYKRILVTTSLLIILISLGFFINILMNGSPLSYMNHDNIQVTFHRGYSYDFPENTLPAIKKAIEEQADYVEVDVRTTKDGELVLFHDNTLKRITGKKQSIENMNYADVATLDVGRWMNPKFEGTRIPTLREVFEICKGKVLLNLELKYKNPEAGLEEKVVSLINEYDMQWQCVISSNNLPSLEVIHKLDPDIQTGYIAYQLFDGLTDNESIDFFSMKSDLITKDLLQTIHKSGKKLYAWTVNSKPELERLKWIGVDNIITDDPVYAKEVLYEPDNDWLIMTLFRMIMD